MNSRLAQAQLLVGLRRTRSALARYDAGSPEARAGWRAARLADLRRHAVAASPYYRSHHRGLADAPLTDLPEVAKVELFESFDDVVTDRRLTRADVEAHVRDGDGSALLAGRYRVGASSGTTGRPGLFPFDRREWVHLLANAARSRQVIGGTGRAGRPRSAKVASPSPWHLSRQVGETLRDPRKPSLRLDATRPVAELATELERWSPDVLTGYPSTLRALAVEQLDGRLALAPCQVLTSGEVLEAGTRRLLVEAWGGEAEAEPFDQYVTTEAGFLAVECSAHDGLHVLDDHVLLEVVDRTGQAVAPGEVGARVLLTALWSRTLPLIRYAIDDRVRLAAGPCSCGRPTPRISTIEGRARQLLTFAGPQGDVNIHPVAMTAVLDTAPVGAWQVRYRRDAIRVVVAQPRGEFTTEDLRRRLIAALRDGGAPEVRVTVDIVPAIPRATTGKATLIAPDR